ncbi:MAG: hypothetical protein ACRC2U_15325, partial [Aeromonas sp.]
DKAPAGVAHLLPWIDDSGTAEAWLGHMTRLAAIADRLHLLTPQAEYKCKKAILLRDRKFAGGNVKAVDSVIALLDRAIAGDIPGAKDWTKAQRTADAAAAAVADAYAAAAAAAAAYAARCAAAAAAAADAAAVAARKTQADKIIDDILSIFEEELA